MNLDWPLSFGVNPGLSAAATREHEFVHDAILDCKAQVTVSWNFLKGADRRLVELSGNFRLDLEQWLTGFRRQKRRFGS
jgi:hypothetical protein